MFKLIHGRNVKLYVKKFQIDKLYFQCTMHSLQYLCESYIVHLLIDALEKKKRKIKKWIINIEEWIAQLDILDIKV